ncbi:hypothetical protein [Arthrobacter sp. NicSoilC12]|uniref:hypothetical protein n=1 Tax=Arthrobacter sp. NicSoilC12 TaxID=2831001 RepID=UPI001CC35A56|nr:hypothetical protein [Arthrobacter sp. NicSoilC12]GIU57109.1 hypothetical protein NicSoilC12_28580 [Arthrobacter sp. NicSoilC12]
MARPDTTGSTRKILLYGDVDLNIIDGSAVWLVSMAEALSRTGSEVCVLLKTHVSKTRLLDRIADMPGVEIAPTWRKRGHRGAAAPNRSPAHGPA